MKLKRKKSKASRDYALPTVFSEPSSNIWDYTFLIFGPPKIGKTSLFSTLKTAAYLMFEEGGKALSIRKKQVTSWEAVEGYLRSAQKADPKKFGPLILDTAEGLYGIAWDHFLAKLEIEHPSDLDYGKGWDAVGSPFRRVLKKYVSLRDIGTVLISHAKRGDRKLASGDVVEDIHPNLSGRPLEEVAGMVDVIGYYHFRRGSRVLQIRGDDEVMAGCRLEENFLYDDGSPIKYIPMGESKQEAYGNFLAAFNNELTKPVERKKKTKLKKSKVR